MNLHDILIYLGIWFLAGVLAFNLIVVFLFRSGLVYAARDQEGHFKRKIPLRGFLTVAGFLCLIIGFIVLSNYISLIVRNIFLDFCQLFLLNLSLMLSLILYDTLVIDWLVIGRWRPSFLHLPEAMNASEMKTHIQRSLIAGPIFGTILALIGTLISIYVLKRP